GNGKDMAGTIERADGTVIAFRNIEGILDITGKVEAGSITSFAVRDLDVSVEVEPADDYVLTDVTLTLTGNGTPMLLGADGQPLTMQPDGSFVVSVADLGGLKVVAPADSTFTVVASVSATSHRGGELLHATADVSTEAGQSIPDEGVADRDAGADTDAATDSDADGEDGNVDVGAPVVTITAGPGEAVSSGIGVTKINGGAESPYGFDIVDGEIVRIGSEVIVWISKGADGQPIDRVPTTVDGGDATSQIRSYANGALPTGGTNPGYADVFVLHANSQFTTNWGKLKTHMLGGHQFNGYVQGKYGDT